MGKGSSALTEVPLSYVNVGLKVGSWAVSSRVFSVVSLVLDVDLGVGVTLVRLTVGSDGTDVSATVLRLIDGNVGEEEQEE